MAITRRMGRAEWLLLLVLSLFSGSAFFLGKVALRELTPFAIVFGRVSLAAVGLGWVMAVTHQRMPRSPRLWRDFLVLGLLDQALPFGLIFWGQTRISSGLASIIDATTPAWVAILAHLFTREKIIPRKAVGVALGICGAATLIGWDFVLGQRGNVIAQLAVVGAALCYAGASLYAQRLSGTPPLVLAFGQVICASLLTLPVAWLTWPRGQPLAVSLPVGLALVTLGLGNTGLAYALYFRLLATAGASNAMLMTLIAPVAANVLGALFLNEVVGLQQVIGMVLIGLGLVIIDGRVLDRRKRAMTA